MKIPKILPVLSTLLAFSAFGATEEPIDSRFKPIAPDPLMGDWQGTPDFVAQVMPIGAGQYQANIFPAFDQPNAKPIAILRGNPAALSGDGWTGAVAGGHLKMSKGAEGFDLQRVTRTPPTLGAKPPAGAVVLFDGTNLDAWANKKGKEWLVEDGPAPWKIVDGGILEVVPGTGGGIISKLKSGDCHLHVEFRTLGAPSNSGVFLETRYEVNINETYGRLEGTPNGGLDNCTEKGHEPKIRASRPPLEWQTFDIDFTAPRFDAAGKKTASATATVLFNGVKIYDQQKLDLPHGAAGRLGEAPTGPLMLQEHGMPVQFRNIWLVENTK
jgi:hypothetical protein